jgi:hypothetical protein
VAIAALYLPVEGVILPAQFVADATPQRLGLVVMAMRAGGLAGRSGSAPSRTGCTGPSAVTPSRRECRSGEPARAAAV